jgi:hypothetical protein
MAGHRPGWAVIAIRRIWKKIVRHNQSPSSGDIMIRSTLLALAGMLMLVFSTPWAHAGDAAGEWTDLLSALREPPPLSALDQFLLDTNQVKRHKCPPGQNPDPVTGVCFSCSHNDHFENGRCVPCKAGFHGEGDECVRDVAEKKKKKEKVASCPPGQNPDPVTGVCFSCSHNDHFENGRCVPCKAGFHEEGDECVRDVAEKKKVRKCPTGKEFRNGRCRTAVVADEIVCEVGETFDPETETCQ